MSSKKAPVKETKTAAKKPAAKPAAKAAAKPAKAKAAEKKPAAKTASASAAKKPAPKAAAKDTKVTEKKAKPAVKAAPAKAAKVAAKPAKAAPKAAEKKPAAKTAPVKATSTKAAAKPAKAAPKVAEKKAAKTPAKVEKVKEPVKDVKPTKNSKAAKDVEKAPKGSKNSKAEPVVDAVVENVPATKGNKKNSVPVETSVETSVEVSDGKKGKDNGKKPANDYDYAVLLEGVKKLSKSVMFTEVDEQEDRSNKKKMSSEMKNLDMKPTASIRRKASLAEETQEELTERILKELEEQNMAFEREAATQMCTRCNRNLVSPEFWVDKHLGYCEECAMILKLGQSKEARKVEYQLGGMGDSLDEEDDEIIGPDADDLKDAEDDLAEMDD